MGFHVPNLSKAFIALFEIVAAPLRISEIVKSRNKSHIYCVLAKNKEQFRSHLLDVSYEQRTERIEAFDLCRSLSNVEPLNVDERATEYVTTYLKA